MSGYLYGLVGHVLKYFRKEKCSSRNEISIGVATPPRESRKQKPATDGSPEDIWKTPEAVLKRRKSFPLVIDPCSRSLGFTPFDSRIFCGHGGGGDFIGPIRPMECSWFDFPEGSSDSLRSLGHHRNQTPLRCSRIPHCLKRSHSLESRPPTPLLNTSRKTEWKTAYEAFHTHQSSSEEEPLKRVQSKIRMQSGRRVSLEDTRRGQVKKTAPCTCRRYTLDNAYDPVVRSLRFEGGEGPSRCPKTVIAHRSQLNAKLERMFRYISKKKYCGNIIDSSSHSRWMKLAGITQDEDASNFKKFAKGRVALTVSQYKSAMQKMCEDHGLDYWNVLQRMTDVPLRNGDSNSLSSA